MTLITVVQFSNCKLKLRDGDGGDWVGAFGASNGEALGCFGAGDAGGDAGSINNKSVAYVMGDVSRANGWNVNPSAAYRRADEPMNGKPRCASVLPFLSTVSTMTAMPRLACCRHPPDGCTATSYLPSPDDDATASQFPVLVDTPPEWPTL